MADVGKGTLVQLWRQLREDSDCPAHFELSQQGEVVQRPSPTNRLQAILAFICEQLREQLGGHAFTRIAISTHGNGIRVPDISWLPSERYDDILAVGPLEACPPVVIEVDLSASAYDVSRAKGYLAAGGVEVVTIDRSGVAAFHRSDGTHAASNMGVNLRVPPEMLCRAWKCKRSS